MVADSHAHTQFSGDSVYPLLAVVRDAAAMGMEEICLTHHVDYGDSGRELCTFEKMEPLFHPL